MKRLLSASERKRRVARANGAKSRGPITAAGKSRASRNAVTHALRSTRILPEEMPEGFTETYHGFLPSLHPPSAGEVSTEQSLTACMDLAWHRLQQLWHMEVDAFRREMANFPELPAGEALAAAFRRLADDGTLSRLHHYETTHSNRLHGAMSQLTGPQPCPQWLAARKAPGSEETQATNEPTKHSTPATSITSGHFTNPEHPRATSKSAAAH